MTRTEAMVEYVIPAIVRMWNDETCDEIIKALKHEPERKKGRWIYPYKSTTLVSICSECGSHGNGSGNYCSNCGARMIKPQEGEE